MASNLSKAYSEAVTAAKASGRPLHEEEAVRFGVTHAQVGAYLMGVWGLPAGLVEAAALHHCPGRSPATEFSLLTAVHVANVFAYEKSGDIHSATSAQFDLQCLSGLGMADKLDAWRSMVTGKPAAQNKAEAKAKTPASVTVVSAPVRAPVQGQAPARNWLTSLLLPAGAVALVAIFVSLFLAPRSLNEPIPVRAKTFQEPPVKVEPTVTQTTAPAPIPEEKVAHPAVETASGTQAAVTEPDTSKTNPVVQATYAPAAPKVGFDAIKLQGVFYNAKSPSVIINGETLRPGEEINGVTVISIGPSSVILSFGGIRKVLQVE